MKLPTADEAVFSIKCYLGAMLALYLAYSIGLPRPFWAMTTAYVVAQPWSGAVRSKAVYRLGGTFFGSAMTIYTVPRLANYPVLMTLAMVLWVGLCLYIAVLDRTPRSYLFMLAGYTAAMIGFPSVTDPALVFDTALARVEEISLGIICATLVHSVVLPRGIGRAMMGRLDATVRDARSWIQDVLNQRGAAQHARDRRTLANDITQLRLLSTHVPFDTGNIRWTANALRAMQEHITALTPAVSAVEDRLALPILGGAPTGRTRRLTRGAALHRDHGLALLSALAAALAISVCCLFWIGTAWTNGATAAMMAAIFSCFFAAQDNPVPGIMQFLTYTIYSIPLSALYLLGIMPALHSFEMLALAIFPVAFVTGVYIARPTTTGKAMAVFFGLSGTLALQDTHAADLVSFVDTIVAQIIGVAVAAIIAAVFRTVSAEWSARRIQAANWKELAALAGAGRAPARLDFTARMLDRIGLLQPRLALSKRRDDQLADDALQDLRVGKDIAELQRARRHLPMADPAIQPVLRTLAGLFRKRPGRLGGERPAELLQTIDRALYSVSNTPVAHAARERAVVALVGLRRAFFPEAAAYRPGRDVESPAS
ncbi:putative membrane protein [Bordetella bronchiseptica MO211]|nr:putative membrane protein [Bordetella bronchiseptica MO211]